MGGDSSERVISLKSAEIVYQELKNIYSCFKIDISKNGWFADVDGKQTTIDKNNFSLNGLKFDAVFIAIHGTPGEDGLLQSYFDLLEIPYTTCNAFVAGLTFNKVVCNALLHKYGVQVAKSLTLRKGEEILEEEIANELGLPLFVKPNGAGSSFGVSMVESAAQIPLAVADALVHDDLVLIESFLGGIEIGCAVHDLNGKAEALPLTEIRSNKKFFDFEAKYEGASLEITPAEISVADTEKIQNTAIGIYKKIGMTGLCRMDFKLDKGVPSLIEINTVPGLSAESIVPQQAKAAGMSLQDLFRKMIERALKSV